MDKKDTKLYGAIALLIILALSTAELIIRDWSLIQGVNLMFHEAGHTLFMFGPRFLTIAMGSGLEILIPLLLTIYFLKDNELLGGMFSLWWTGTALWSVGIYVSDAVSKQLRLLGGDGGIHDWNYLLSNTNLLHKTLDIGAAISTLGTICISIALGILCLFIYEQFETKKEDKDIQAKLDKEERIEEK